MDFKILIFKRNLNQYPGDVIKFSNESRQRTDSYLETYSGKKYYIYKVYDKLLDEFRYVFFLNINIIYGESVQDVLRQLSDYGYTISNPYKLKLLPVALSETDYK